MSTPSGEAGRDTVDRLHGFLHRFVVSKNYRNAVTVGRKSNLLDKGLHFMSKSRLNLALRCVESLPIAQARRG